MRIKINIPAVFTVVSGFVFLLGTYLLITKTSLHPQFFIAACGEVLKNVSQHVHFNPEGVVSSLVLFIASVGISLSLWQFIRFLVGHRRLHRLERVDRTPKRLQKIMNKHKLEGKTVLLAKESNLTAYTIGLFKPRIVVSQSLVGKLTEEQLEAVILHELFHLRSRHVLWLLFSRLISSLFFFIPLIEYLAKQLRTEFELAADAFVVEKQKTKDHLCASLALNLQYAGDVVPHFSTSPIERRVESLFGNKLSLERIGIKSLSISMLSLVLMLGIAFLQPRSISANSDLATGGVCSEGEKCLTTDCSGFESEDIHNFTPIVPASFPPSSSH